MTITSFCVFGLKFFCKQKCSCWSQKNNWYIFFNLLSKHMLQVLVRTASLRQPQRTQTRLFFFMYMYTFVWIQHTCLTNMDLTLDPSSSGIKRLWFIIILYKKACHCWEHLPNAINLSSITQNRHTEATMMSDLKKKVFVIILWIYSCFPTQ